MMTDINESILMSVLDPPPTHQPAVYQLRLPRENPYLVSSALVHTVLSLTNRVSLRCTILYIHLSTLPLRIAIVLTGNLLLLGNQQLTISTECTKLMNT